MKPLILVLTGVSLFVSSIRAEEGEVEKLHSLIKPQAGESRWMEIDWYPSVWEGLKLAAEEGKPIFLMAGSGGAPCSGC